jgi:ABC-2 type transport system permease protein
MSRLFRDTWLLFRMHLSIMLRNPVWVIIGLFQPVCWILLFAPLLERLTGIPGFSSGNSFNIFTPGLLVMTALYSAAFAGFGLIAHLRSGVVERLRVTPASRLALLLGMVMRDVLVMLVQCGLLVMLSLLMGLRPDPLGLLLTVGLLILIGLTLAACSYGVALIVKDEGALAAAVNFITLPMMLLSGITLPLVLAPPLLQNIARFNPFAHAVDAARALVNGHLGEQAVLLGFGVFGVLTVLSLFWATRSMRQATM